MEPFSPSLLLPGVGSDLSEDVFVTPHHFGGKEDALGPGDFFLKSLVWVTLSSITLLVLSSDKGLTWRGLGLAAC